MNDWQLLKISLRFHLYRAILPAGGRVGNIGLR
jgi:hypothetical protein